MLILRFATSNPSRVDPDVDGRACGRGTLDLASMPSAEARFKPNQGATRLRSS
jgi:hypothetical protein